MLANAEQSGNAATMRVRLPKTRADALQVLAQRGLLPKWSYLCVQAAIREMAKKHG